jgi:stress response protein SCP2
MAISLQKGGNINLSKEAPGMKKMIVGLGWDVRSTDGDGFDLDASAFLLNNTGKVRSMMPISSFTTRRSLPTAASSMRATTARVTVRAMTSRS